MLDETYQYLTDRGFAKGEAQANTQALATACIAQMAERTVQSTDVQEVSDKGLLASELRGLILGDPGDEEIEEELDIIVGRLIGPKGTVQLKLRDSNLVLCSAKVTRTLPGNGNGGQSVSRTAKFLSDDPDVIETFYLVPEAEAGVRKAQSLQARWDLAVQRQPILANRRRAFLDRTQQRLQLELGSVAA